MSKPTPLPDTTETGARAQEASTDARPATATTTAGAHAPQDTDPQPTRRGDNTPSTDHEYPQGDRGSRSGENLAQQEAAKGVPGRPTPPGGSGTVRASPASE